MQMGNFHELRKHCKLLSPVNSVVGTDSSSKSKAMPKHIHKVLGRWQNERQPNTFFENLGKFRISMYRALKFQLLSLITMQAVESKGGFTYQTHTPGSPLTPCLGSHPDHPLWIQNVVAWFCPFLGDPTWTRNGSWKLLTWRQWSGRNL